jgi:uncharacterized protein (DUF2252 family)
MLTIDPVRLARRQIEIDRERTRRLPDLFLRKVARMSASPLALLRGSAPLFYEFLKAHPTLPEGPPGEGWLVGDAHLENFGAYRTGALKVADSRARPANDGVVFDLNDFDEAFIGPWRLDVLRLLTSLILGGREMGVDGRRALELSDALLDAYVGALFHRKRVPQGPPVVNALVDKVCERTRAALLDARTTVARGERRFVRGERYAELTPKLRARAEKAFAKYGKRLSSSERVPVEALEVLDVAFRIAGTGSLGGLRVAFLVRGKGGRDGAWVFDMKAQDAPSAACLVRPPSLVPAERVVTAIEACLASPPRMIGTTKLRGESMFVRRLTPQEDKLDLVKLASDDLAPLARHLGALLGVAHRRGAKRSPKRTWTEADRAGICARAIALAGMHESMYLAYCDQVRR